MKKLGAILVTCFLGLSLTACGTAPAEPEGSAVQPDIGSGSAVIESPEIPSEGSAVGSLGSSERLIDDPNTRTYRDCTITVIGYSLREDENGKPALRVEYLFENNSKTPASFSTTVISNAYQDANEKYEEPLGYATPKEADPEYSATLTLVQPGEEITCAGYYELESPVLPVYLKILDLRDSTSDALIRTIEILDLPIEDPNDKEAQPAA